MSEETENRIKRLKARVERLEHDRFMHQMEDRWDILDLQEEQRMADEIRQLQLEINALEEE